MKVYELLATEDRWTQGWFAKDKDGNAVMNDWRTNPEVTCFCLAGAVEVCYPIYNDLQVVFNKLFNKIGNITAFNDTHTHAEVLALVKELDI